MANRIRSLALPAQRTALDMPEDFSVFLFNTHALIGKSIEELGKGSCPRRQFCREWQQTECHFGDSHLCAILAHTIIKAGAPYAESKPTSSMRTIGVLHHFSEVCYSSKGKFQLVVIGWIIIDQ